MTNVNVNPSVVSGIDLDLFYFWTLLKAPTTATSTKIIFKHDEVFQDIFNGTFSYDSQGFVTSGTILSCQATVTDLPYLTFAGLSLSVEAALSFIRAVDNAGLARLIFSSGDTFVGAAGGDVFRGFEGGDNFYGYGGNDTLDGGAGADTAHFKGAARDYTIARQADGSFLVTDNRPGSPDGTDRLLNIETGDFEDGRRPLFSSEAQALLSQHQRVLRTDPAFGYNAAEFNATVHAMQFGGLTSAQSLAAVVQLADATTSVATLAYQFFTGRTPTVDGLSYLVAPSGPNPNNLNSAYYQFFNLENRYINFAVNLGKNGEGAAQFKAAYDSRSLIDSAKAAYATIFGSTPTDAKAHALVDSRIDYFATYGGDGPEGIGTKAAMVGWLLAEAVKADVGVMQTANMAYLSDLGRAQTNYSVDLIGVYHGTPHFGG